jgi:FkbM family methyltransferase
MSEAKSGAAPTKIPDFASLIRATKRKRIVGVTYKTGYACAAFIEDPCLTSANDTSPAPFGALAPNAAQRAVIALARRTRLKRGAFRPMLSRLLNLLRAGPIDVPYQGAAFRFYHQSSATERGALLNPDYNVEELDFLRAHTPASGVFVDVGANAGTYALPLARHVGPEGRVVAVEPHPVMVARLAFNQAASESGNVALIATAAGDVDGDLMIETDHENYGASHVYPDASARSDAIRVPALRLLRVVQDQHLEKIDSLKIDVEGYEDRVLIRFFRDAPPALWPRAIAIEHLSRDDWADDCLADMLARGYVEAGKTRSNTLLVLSSR